MRAGPKAKRLATDRLLIRWKWRIDEMKKTRSYSRKSEIPAKGAKKKTRAQKNLSRVMSETKRTRNSSRRK